MATTAAGFHPEPSPLTKVFSYNPTSDPLRNLAVQIQHNLNHQHAWTALRLHTLSPLTNAPLPRPLLSGLPPLRLYTHPDEQVQLLKEAEVRRKAARRQARDTGIMQEEDKEAASEGLDVQVEAEREWVLPTRLSERWSLRRLAEVFDAVGVIPPLEGEEEGLEKEKENKWRTTKRVVLATVDSDSTVVYYIVHDGVVKPRQN